MLPGARILFAGKKSAPLPYDYEVAYIERDCSIPWVDSDGNEILGYFDLSRYEIAGETLGTMRPLEATWSFEPISAGYAYALSLQNLFLTRGCMKPPSQTTYGFAYQSGQFSEIEGNIDTFHKQRMIYQDGHIKGYIDDVLVIDASISGTNKVVQPRVLYTPISTSSIHYNGKARVRNVRLGSDVYLIPVVKGNAVGFYNMVDGEMFLAEQECLSAGPRV